MKKSASWLVPIFVVLFILYNKGVFGDLFENELQGEETPTVTIHTPVELRDYLNDGFTQGITNFKFQYTGNETFDAGELARIACASYVSTNINEGYYKITLYDYPGDRMVKAHFSSDLSGLTEEEKLTLEQALEMVNRAKAEASDDFELELKLHDMLVDSITYESGDFNFSRAEDLPRALTSVGALRDGRANCQGYTDAFYLLGSLAGFQVDRIFVESNGNPHVANTIQLGGQWYILDVTHDDREKEDFRCYSHFNAGCDMLPDSYTWRQEWEYRPIAKISSDCYYYRHQNVIYSSVEAMAAAVADEVAAKWNGRDPYRINAMALEILEQEKTGAALVNALNRRNIRSHISYLSRDNGKYSFYTITVKAR